MDYIDPFIGKERELNDGGGGGVFVTLVPHRGRPLGSEMMKSPILQNHYFHLSLYRTQNIK